MPIRVKESGIVVRKDYHPRLVEALRRSWGYWNPDRREWWVPLFGVPRLIEDLRRLAEEGIHLLTGEEAHELQEVQRYADGVLLQVLNDPFESESLLPEQAEDVASILVALWELWRKGPRGFLLANGTGTGKTYVYAAFLKAVERLGLEGLVVVPNQDLAEQTRLVLERFGARAEITTYGRLDPRNAWRRVLVLDEAHLAKRSFRSERGRRAWTAVQRAIFTLFVTATPFDKPWESEYLLVPTGALEAWGEVDFEGFMARFKVYPQENPWRQVKEYRFVGGPEDLKAFHDTLRRKDFMTRRFFCPPEGLVEHEVRPVEIPEKERALLREVRARLKRAAALASLEDRGVIAAQRTMLSRALLERYKLEASYPLLEELLREGWHVALFLQYRSDRVLDFSTEEGIAAYLAEAGGKEEGGRIAQQMAEALEGLTLHLPSPTAMVRERFGFLGDALAFYTGAEAEGALWRAKEGWREGKVKLLVLTAQKGGTGLSLHDTTGKRPTAQVVMTLPWTGTQLDQVLGRVVRVGLASPVKVVFPAAGIPAEKRMAAVLAESLRTLGYAVRGGEMPVPEEVVQAFLHDYASVDEEGFQRLLAGVVLDG